MLHIQIIAAWLKTRPASQRGASLVEYALLIALLAVVCIAAVSMLGGAANTKFSALGSGIG